MFFIDFIKRHVGPQEKIIVITGTDQNDKTIIEKVKLYKKWRFGKWQTKENYGGLFKILEAWHLTRPKGSRNEFERKF